MLTPKTDNNDFENWPFCKIVSILFKKHKRQFDLDIEGN